MSLRLTVAAAATLAAVGCAYDPEPESSRVRQALVGGNASAGDPAVVALLDAHGGLSCTGVLVGPEAVVTAAHCLVDTSRPRVFFGAEVGGAGTIVEAVSHAIDPAYQTGAVGSDLGILLLAEPSPVTPLRLGPPPAKGTPLRLVGFGADDATSHESGGLKRTGGAHVDEVQADHMRIVPDPAQPCAGDSGSPALAIVDGAEQVVGIVSRGDPDCAAFALLSHANRAVMLGEDIAPGAAIGGCLVGDGSEPAFGLAMLALAWRRRQR